MSEATSRANSTRLKETQGNQPEFIDLDRIETGNGFASINENSVRFESLTEATLRYETPKAREAREKKELTDQAHKHLIGLIKIILACVLLIGFFALGVSLFAFKLYAIDAQKTYATVITAIVSGGVGYAFGKQENCKADKE